MSSTADSNSSRDGLLERIVMLVPHDPDEDPRVGWALRLCRELARTDVLAASAGSPKPVREYDGRVYVERFSVYELASGFRKLLCSLGTLPGVLGPARRFTERLSQLGELRRGGGALRRSFQRIDMAVGRSLESMARLAWMGLLSHAIYRRARAVCLPPAVVVCHDVYALVPAVRLKRKFGWRVLYDCHEYWPQADLSAPRWTEPLMRWIEGRSIRQADRVVTVTPQLARELERCYGIRGVLIAPNAEPLQALPPTSCGGIRSSREGDPVVFLFQGRVTAGRGLEILLQGWRGVDASRARLVLRCPPCPELERLRGQFSDLFEEGRVVLKAPVREHELVDAARDADVGVIPYPGPNLNHVYACPNKLSQYLQAGLALLSTDIEFVSELIDRYGCGRTYSPRDPKGVVSAVTRMVDDRGVLQQMRERAADAARREFHWEAQAQSYREALQGLVARLGIGHPGATA